LTMTFVDGMGWAAAQQADQDLKNTWAEVIFRFVMGSHRHSSFFHGDPHPGNYCFGADGTVGFVDFGCVKFLPESSRRQLIEMERATVDGRRHDLRELMVQSGYLTESSDLTADDAYEWWTTLLEDVLAPQPVTYSSEDHRRAMRSMFDSRSPDHPVRRISVPNDFVLLSRVKLSMSAICAQLGATLHVRSVADDMDGITQPITPLGKRHEAWLQERGLPHGLDHRDRG
jgi:predicted unusual protein kinase regulating ubiquinone biosynthesis (AarF/ABC1/UbiB family)